MPPGIDQGVLRARGTAWRRPQNALTWQHGIAAAMQLPSCSSGSGTGLKSLVDIEMDGIWG